MKVCSQCGTENNDIAKFCKGCGNNIEAAQPVQSVQPQQSAYAQPAQSTQPVQPTQSYAQPVQSVPQTQPVYAQPVQPQQPVQQGVPQFNQPANQVNADQMMHFFRWLVSAIKHPSQKYHVSSLYAVLVFVLSAFVSGIQTYCSVQSGANMFNSLSNVGTNLLASAFNTSLRAPQVSVPISVFFAAFVAALISAYMTFVVALIGAKMFGDPMPAAQLHVQFGQKMVPIVAIQICAALSGILTLTGFSVLLQIFATILTILLPFSFVSHAECTRKMDREWLWVIYVLVAIVVLLITLAVTMGIVGSALASVTYHSIFN